MAPKDSQDGWDSLGRQFVGNLSSLNTDRCCICVLVGGNWSICLNIQISWGWRKKEDVVTVDYGNMLEGGRNYTLRGNPALIFNVVSFIYPV